MDRQDEERTSPGALGDDRQESGVDGAEVVVLDVACDGHAIKAALLGGGLTEHMAELGAPVLRTPCHLKGGRGSEGEGRGQSRTAASQLGFSHCSTFLTSTQRSHSAHSGVMHFLKYEQLEGEM